MNTEEWASVLEAGRKAVEKDNDPLKSYFTGLMIGIISAMDARIDGQKAVIDMLDNRLSRIESKVFSELLGGDE